MPPAARVRPLVRIEAATVSHLDATVANGDFVVNPSLPYVPGVEGAVVVESDVFSPGQQVIFRDGALGLTGDGSWREYASAPNNALMPLDVPLPPSVAATFFTPVTTAYVALFDIGCLQPGQTVTVDKVDELRKMIRVVDEAGLQIAIHCIGDKTCEVVVDALAELTPNSPYRPYLIHGTELYAEGLQAMARYGIGWTSNPVIISAFATTLPEDRRRTEPLGSALRAGIRPGITSDAPVVPPDWRPAVVYAVTRSGYWEGDVPEDDKAETMTTLDALALLTREAAYREHDEDRRGTPTVGQRADLAVLDGPWPDDEHVDEILRRSIVLTMVDGQIVHRV